VFRLFPSSSTWHRLTATYLVNVCCPSYLNCLTNFSGRSGTYSVYQCFPTFYPLRNPYEHFSRPQKPVPMKTKAKANSQLAPHRDCSITANCRTKFPAIFRGIFGCYLLQTNCTWGNTRTLISLHSTIFYMFRLFWTIFRKSFFWHRRNKMLSTTAVLNTYF